MVHRDLGSLVACPPPLEKFEIVGLKWWHLIHFQMTFKRENIMMDHKFINITSQRLLFSYHVLMDNNCDLEIYKHDKLLICL